MLVSFKVGAHLALFLFGACEAGTDGARAAEPQPSDPGPAPESPAPPPRPQATPRRSDVHLELTAFQPSYWLGEPVTLVASVVNASSEPVELYPYLHPEYSFLDVRVTEPGGKQRAYYPPFRREGGRGAEPVLLEPGARLSDLVPLFLSSDGWFLAEPGGYAIEARFAPDKEPLVAEPVRLEIRAPQAEDDAAAARVLMEPGTARALYDPGGASSPQQVAQLEKLVQAYPESHLAPYAHLALGRHWNREALDPSTKGVRPADPERALRSLELAVEGLGDPLHWTQAAIELARCYELLDDPRAGEARERARRRFPEVWRTQVVQIEGKR
jgi:hypothetical protein